MELLLKRVAKKLSYTIGHLYIDGKYFCDTLEDADRGLDSKQSLDYIKRNKKKTITAIPTGKYKVLTDIVSPRFSLNSFYKEFANGGRVPRLYNVPGFDGILIHCGNTSFDTDGCILVGENKQVGKVINSKETFKKLYKELKSSISPIYITIE